LRAWIIGSAGSIFVGNSAGCYRSYGKNELDLSVSRLVNQQLVDIPGFEADRLLVPDALGILPDGDLAGKRTSRGFSRSVVFSCQ
jgi:hypothetical protein